MTNFHHHPHHCHHQLQGLGLLAFPDLRVRRIEASISLVADLSLFFLEDDSLNTSKITSI
jgi:hypothetical protein